MKDILNIFKILIFNNFLFAYNYININNEQNSSIVKNEKTVIKEHNDRIDNYSGFNQWIKENSKKNSYIGLGKDEEFAFEYTVNAKPTLKLTTNTNFYTMFMLNNYRIEVGEGYDILRNNGLKNNKLLAIPFIGIGFDLGNADFSSFIGMKFLSFLYKNIGFELIGKYFLTKTTTYITTEKQTFDSSGRPQTRKYTYIENKDKEPDKKKYIGFYIIYKF